MKTYLLILFLLATLNASSATLSTQEAQEDKKAYSMRPTQEWKSDYGDIHKEKNYKQLKYAMDLLSNTVGTIGPKVKNVKMRYSGNSLNCTSCHLEGPSGLPGTKKFAAPLTNVMNDYPKFAARVMRVESIKDRVNGCMTRSQGDGKPFPMDSKEMNAIIAYFTFLAKGTLKNSAMKGTGLMKITFPDRKANIVEGKEIYSLFCMACHQKEGEGLPSSRYGIDASYDFTPLSGKDSFDNGAGMSRLMDATRFIYANMPLGAANPDKPKLSINQAYDVAAYVLSLPRPNKANRKDDFPNPDFRPTDYPVPYYFSNDKKALGKAKYGPFN